MPDFNTSGDNILASSELVYITKYNDYYLIGTEFKFIVGKDNERISLN